ncbi:two-component system sensor histidine kinase NtrB [Chelatococcus reniformis]|uniref:histidine kinase n=1 Tax=Chelatococcus reniformis TaxID=1494448 RepID=A0A916U166_9HYPH|nr:ATP-binding protein [Chelatococcus reniformis]GGC55758.1 PAS domain-containing sensor histidine kinase [Chelatococcus reniformis]
MNSGRVSARSPISRAADGAVDSAQILNVLPVPVLTIGPGNVIVDANVSAEDFFEQSLAMLRRLRLSDLLSFGSPVLGMIDDVRERGSSVSGYRVAVGRPRPGGDCIADVFAAPLRDDAENVVLMLQERTIAEKMDRQLTTRGAARSVTALGSMLAHEIKNPLSGIRGAAQLLEQSANDDDRLLTQLICDEADRIVKLVERMEFFGDERPVEREAVNIHGVLDHVKRLAQSGFARHIRLEEIYDPSLPPVLGNRDQLIQVFLNLVKNAAEAIGQDAMDGQITLATAFRPGMRMQVPGSRAKVSLPLEFRVTDNGPGVPSDILPDLFDPFVTTKAQGSGLGLALVAKVIGDHGGVVECESGAHRTTFRVLMPMFTARDGRGAGT